MGLAVRIAVVACVMIIAFAGARTVVSWYKRVMQMLALIAHDRMKDRIVSFCESHRETLERFDLIATGTTGSRIAEATGLSVTCMLSGPVGGDAQIAAQVATGGVHAVIFLVDPLHAHPHEPDIQGLMRVCNVHEVPFATNAPAADLLLSAITAQQTTQR
ncbi:MAG: methylglyoxal synthase [Phycisphaeraceae bacterium]